MIFFAGPEYTFQEYVKDFNAFRATRTLEKRLLYKLAVNDSSFDGICPSLRQGIEDAKAAVKFARHDAGFSPQELK